MKTKEDKNELRLKVAEAMQDDVNRGVVRIDNKILREIGLREGDIIEIEGGSKTVGIVDRALPGDLGLDIIRMDGIIRRNAKSSLGELVAIRKVDVKEATKVVIAPAKQGVMIRAPPDMFRQGLLGRAAVKGDVISFGGTKRRRKTLSSNPFFDDIFSSVFEDAFNVGFGFGDLKFIVVETNPKGPVIITENTEIEVRPEAVELEKEAALPEVTYEDIGGLDEEIKKVREMIELPMKHPEIFERLGVEPPKGVLLHGPPGTGKTLLAKAVAGETNAHFILINGPEIMSKYYGQSLPADEKVLVMIDNKLKRIPIGELVNKQPENAKAVCFDAEGKIVIKDISSFIKHKNNSKLVKIKTSSGRSIRVTDDHSVFTLGKNGIESIKTSYLVAGKSFVAVPKKLPEPQNSTEKLDLIELLNGNDYGATIRNIQNLLKEAVDNLGIKRVATILNCRERYVYDIISKNVGINLSKFVDLMKKSGIEYDKDALQISTKGKSLPATMLLTDELCAFFGLWMAEGSYTNKNEVRISINESELKYFEQLITGLFGTVTIYKKPRSKGADIIICSGILGKVMKALGFISGARNKKVPDFIYNLNNKKLAEFLRGYISGDGSINTTTPAPMVEIASESPELTDDITHLLLRFGIVAKIYLRPNRPQRRICFADTDNLEAFKAIGFIQPEKNEPILKYTNLKKFSRRDRVPIAGFVEELVQNESELKSWKGLESVGRNVLLKLEDPKLKAILGSDIYWDKVLEITECSENPEFVYDISVPGCENFIAGFGGIFAHNSEENLRKKFEEAETNAPSIIFIDEIDAIATKREEVQGEVEKRVVAQLLAMMDGLKTRGKVVVIAATNIVNSLDPALRRPGRFDREIEIGVPSKAGRLNVLKIHTRNMPILGTIYSDILEKNVLPTIKQKTEEINATLSKKREEIKRIQTQINDLKKIKTTADESYFGKILSKIKNLDEKQEELIKELDEHKKSIQELEKIKENLSNDKEKFRQLVEEMKKIEEARRMYNYSDPRINVIENEASEIYKRLKELEVVAATIDRTAQEGIVKDQLQIAEITHGFVGADIAALAKEAAMIVIRKVIPDLNIKGEKDHIIPKATLEKLWLTRQDFIDALKIVRPSALREVLVEIPNVRWDDIGGLEETKKELIEAVEWPLQHPEAFTRLGVKPPKGVLLYGPPGTGKTMLAKAVANESKANFISIKGPELLSKWVGDSEKAVRKIFEKARQTSPTIIFFDEIDSIAPKRGMSADSRTTEQVVNQLLTEMDGVEEMKDVVVIAATNRPDIIDPALLRPGRFDRLALVQIPDEAMREKIFKVHIVGMPLKNVDIKKLAERTEGYVGADIEAICREAAIMALRKDMKTKEITQANFDEALTKVKPSVDLETKMAYEKLEGEMRAAKAKEIKPKITYFG